MPLASVGVGALLATTVTTTPATAAGATNADPDHHGAQHQALQVMKRTNRQPLDPQRWENPDDMTWGDYVPVPGTHWSDPSLQPTKRTFHAALVLLDFPDQDFTITKPAGSDIYGNPQALASDVPADEVADFYEDFLNTPSALNHGHTLNEYWMEDSAGRFGVDIDAFGAYRMPFKSYQYGINRYMNPGACPSDVQCGKSLRQDGDKAWRDDVGDVADDYDIIFFLTAGQDESSTWQEFGQMLFQTKEDVPDAWGPPDPSMPNWAHTRYVDWTSWKAASNQWPNAGGGLELPSSTQAESSGSSTFAHEFSHLLGIGDNYNNPYGDPISRSYTGPWSMLSRGTFNGPGGPHNRWEVPPTQGSSLGSEHVLRDKLKLGIVDEKNVMRLSRDALDDSGIVVAKVTAREVPIGKDSPSGVKHGLYGVNVKLGHDLEAPCDRDTHPLCDGGGYDNYTMELVDRMGADSFTPDHGVMIAKTKNKDRAPFVWTVDANPQDINMVDFYKPDGTPQMITIGDYRQLSDALFHEGTLSGSEYEYVDQANRLHFYIVDKHRTHRGVLKYTVAIKSLDGSGPQPRGVHLGKGASHGKGTKKGAVCRFDLTNTGHSAGGGQRHPEDVTKYLQSDVYRLSAKAPSHGWSVWLPNELSTAKFGRSTKVHTVASALPSASRHGTVVLTAQSVSDPSKTSTATCHTRR